MVITISCIEMTVNKCVSSCLHQFLGNPIWDRILEQIMFQTNTTVVPESILVLVHYHIHSLVEHAQNSD